MSDYTNREILAEPTFPKVPQPVKGMSYLEVLLYNDGVYGEKSGRWLGSSKRPGAVLLSCPCALAIELSNPYEDAWRTLATSEVVGLEALSDVGDDDVKRNLKRTEGEALFSGDYSAKGDDAANVKTEIVEEKLDEGYRKITRQIMPGSAVGRLWTHFSRLLAADFSLPYKQDGETITLYGMPRWDESAKPTLENYVSDDDDDKTFKEGTSAWLNPKNAATALLCAEYSESAEVSVSFGVEGTDGITRWDDVADEYRTIDLNDDGVITEDEKRIPHWIKEKDPDNKKDYSGGALTVQGQSPYPNKTFPLGDIVTNASAHLGVTYRREKKPPILICLHGYNEGETLLLPITIKGALYGAEKIVSANVKLKWWPMTSIWENMWPTTRRLGAENVQEHAMNIGADTNAVPEAVLLEITVPQSRLIYLDADFYVDPLITTEEITALAKECECTITETREAPYKSWRTSFTDVATLSVSLSAIATVNLAGIRHFK